MLAKQRESLVYFDHMLDVVERGYQLVVDFAHALWPLLLVICVMTLTVVYGEGYNE